MKYLVMECHEDYAVLLDEEAGFVKAVNAGYTVGDTVENPELLLAAFVSHRSIIRKVTYGLAAAAACIAVAFGINHYNEYMKPYSNIRLSINPDVEMVLNHHGQVLSLAGLNEDGEELIAGYDPKRQDRITVADDLIERAIDMGYLSDDAVIIFDIDTPDEKLLTQYGIELRSEAEIYTREFANVNIIIIDRKHAKEDDQVYDDDDYEPIVIPIPGQPGETTVPKTEPPVTTPAPSDSGYEEDDDGDSEYGGSKTTTTIPSATAPSATNTVPDNSGYGDSDYDDDDHDDDDDDTYDIDD